MKKICFVTKSDTFDQLISDFRRANIDAHKRDLKDSFTQFDVLIVDLNYPLEHAYTLLDRLNNDYHFSETLIIAAVTSKDQIAKVRSLALGCSDYISPKISFRDLYKKIQELENPEKNLLKKDFKNLKTKMSFDGSLTHISENGCLVRSKVSLDRDQDHLKMKSKLTKDLHLSNEVQFSISRSNPVTKKSYVTEIHFQNLKEDDHDRIRQMIKEWSIS